MAIRPYPDTFTCLPRAALFFSQFLYPLAWRPPAHPAPLKSHPTHLSRLVRLVLLKITTVPSLTRARRCLARFWKGGLVTFVVTLHGFTPQWQRCTGTHDWELNARASKESGGSISNILYNYILFRGFVSSKVVQCPTFLEYGNLKTTAYPCT